MKRQPLMLLLLVAVLTAFIFAGCGGVQLSARYSQLLDQTTALSAETAARAKAGQLAPEQMTQSLVGQAQTWQKFRDARDAK